MIALIQRVSAASVIVAKQPVASIDNGVLALIGIEKRDSTGSAERLIDRIVSYRIFPDEQERMNLDLIESGGELLLVPQFTLVADTSKGRRPGFSQAASPQLAESLFLSLVDLAMSRVTRVGTGRFGANMQVCLTNDGPVTFWLRAEPEQS